MIQVLSEKIVGNTGFKNTYTDAIEAGGVGVTSIGLKAIDADCEEIVFKISGITTPTAPYQAWNMVFYNETTSPTYGWVVRSDGVTYDPPYCTADNVTKSGDWLSDSNLTTYTNKTLFFKVSIRNSSISLDITDENGNAISSITSSK